MQLHVIAMRAPGYQAWRFAARLGHAWTTVERFEDASAVDNVEAVMPALAAAFPADTQYDVIYVTDVELVMYAGLSDVADLAIRYAEARRLAAVEERAAAEYLSYYVAPTGNGWAVSLYLPAEYHGGARHRLGMVEGKYEVPDDTSPYHWPPIRVKAARMAADWFEYVDAQGF